MATETTSNSAFSWSPDVTTIAPSEAVPEALILTTSTVSGAVEGDAVAVRAAYIDDATAGFTGEGAPIDEADPNLAEVVVYTGKVSQLVRLSREQWSQDTTSALISASVGRAVTKAANLAYIAQAAPVGPATTPPAGLLNIAGIVNGGPITDDLDALADALATLEANGATPSHIIASPSAWGYLRKFKVGTSRNDTLLGAGTQDLEKRLLGIPVLTSSAVPTGKLIVVDNTAIVSAVGQIQVAVSDQVYFNSDSVGVRCTWRFGANLVKPNRIAHLTVTNPASE
jgi:HK97 family phage major capsid protein